MKREPDLKRTNRYQILVLEDNTAAAARHVDVGVANGGDGNVITVRVHRFNGGPPELAASRSYRAGAKRGQRNGRINFALRLLWRANPGNGSVVVAGTSYGSAGAFVDSLANQGVPFVVEVRPSTLLDIAGARMKAGDLLAQGKWRKVAAELPDGTNVVYTAAKLADVALPRGNGRLFAARVGGVEGAERSTVIGISSFDAALEELLRLVGYSRWIRPASRRQARSARGAADGAEPEGKAAGLRARANITLARRQDERPGSAPPAEAGFVPWGELGAQRASLKVVELFAGAGGMGLGFLLAGGDRARYRIVYSGEANPIYVQTLRANHAAVSDVLRLSFREVAPSQTEPADLRRRDVLDKISALGRRVDGVDVLIGGPPCQGFSMANRNSWHGRNPHNRLVDVFLQYVEVLRPRVFLMENVQGILWTPKGGSAVSVVDVLERRLRALGYLIFPKLLDAVWYGVPQHRTRFFLLGVHRNLGYDAADFGDWGPFPLPTHGPGRQPYVTVAEAIGDLPPVGNGADSETLEYREPARRELARNTFLRYARCGAERDVITDHVTSKHADYVIERYRKIPQGGNWEDIKDDLTNYADVARTHSNIYRRLRWDEPAITIGHYRKSMLVHPEQHRGLSLREAARLQSFPDWARFLGTHDGMPGGLMHKQQQLANAVCPLVTKAIADFILQL